MHAQILSGKTQQIILKNTHSKSGIQTLQNILASVNFYDKNRN